MLTSEQTIKDFPILSRKINGKRLVYLDNAATTQKPTRVLEAIETYYRQHNANVHRGIHTLSEEATKMYEEARVTLQKFINARHPEEIIFTRGTTDSLNFVARTYAEEKLKIADTILFSELEHHSNLVPWQIAAKKTGAKIEVLKIDNEGFVDVSLKECKEQNIKLIAISHASNVFGTIQNIKEISKWAHERGALLVVDGAQAVPHIKVDVQSLGCDFYAFSGHKMLGPMGIGVLYIKKELQESLAPYQYGGGMIREVGLETATWDLSPSKFEAGTPNVEGAIGLAAACSYLNQQGIENVRKHELELLEYLSEEFAKDKEVIVYGPKESGKRTGVIAFNVSNIHPHDLASVLDTEGVAIRSGHHCTMPLHKKLGVPATARVSFHIYNTKDDIDILLKGMEKARKVLL
ncbi:MAG: SufS family cysteine desulfurase [Patescibacteria group bacterium]